MKIQYLGFIPAILLVLWTIYIVNTDSAMADFIKEVVFPIIAGAMILIIIITGLTWAIGGF